MVHLLSPLTFPYLDQTGPPDNQDNTGMLFDWHKQSTWVLVLRLVEVDHWTTHVHSTDRTLSLWSPGSHKGSLDPFEDFRGLKLHLFEDLRPLK
jgi:hypothetical protein